MGMAKAGKDGCVVFFVIFGILMILCLVVGAVLLGLGSINLSSPIIPFLLCPASDGNGTRTLGHVGVSASVCPALFVLDYNNPPEMQFTWPSKYTSSYSKYSIALISSGALTGEGSVDVVFPDNVKLFGTQTYSWLYSTLGGFSNVGVLEYKSKKSYRIYDTADPACENVCKKKITSTLISSYDVNRIRVPSGTETSIRMKMSFDKPTLSQEERQLYVQLYSSSNGVRLAGIILMCIPAS